MNTTCSDARPEPARDTDAARAQTLVEGVRAWAARRADPITWDERRAMPPHVVLDLARMGVFGLLVPREHGGDPLPLVHALRVVEQLAAVDLSLGGLVGVDLALGVRPIVRHGSDEAKARYLPDLAAGRMLAGLALTEPGASTNPRALLARAAPTPRGYRLFGDKSWIGNAGWAGVVNVFARVEGERTEIAGFVVPLDADGVTIGAEAPTMGVRAMVQNALHFQGVEVPASARLDGGVAALGETLGFGRLGIAALGLGAMQRCLQLAHRWADRRTIATGRLLDHPNARAALAEGFAAVELTRAVVEGLARRIDRGEALDDAWLLAAKVVVPEVVWSTVDAAMQLLGARGYTEGRGLARRFRDARLLRIFEGPTEALGSHLGARAMLDPSVSALLDDAPDLAAEVARWSQIARDATRDRRRPLGVRRPLSQQLAIHLGELTANAFVEALARQRRRAHGEHGVALAEARRQAARLRLLAALRGEAPPARAWLTRQAAALDIAVGVLEDRARPLDFARDPTLAP